MKKCYNENMKTNAITVRFNALLSTLKDSTILRLPNDISKQLPSRGQVAVKGTINGREITTVLEPDGDWGHWMRISDKLQKSAGITAGDTVALALETTKDWPEPEIPSDFKEALIAAPQKVKEKWQDITPMARWEWIRWVNATGNAATRAIRIEKSISKLSGSHRRPCCFNLAACTDPSLSKSGKLIGITPN